MTTSAIIFLGSGSSTGVPTPLCVVQPSDPPCEVCLKAIEKPPEQNKNYRCNPSIMIRYVPSQRSDSISDDTSDAGTGPRYIQVDCGKCFREQVLRWYLHHKIPRLDSLILTHEHADAIFGLDDIRGLQPPPGPSNPSIHRVPVYVTQHTMDSVIEKFAYLVSAEQRMTHSSKSKGTRSSSETNGDLPVLEKRFSGSDGDKAEESQPQVEEGRATKPPVFRRVTQLDWRLITPSLDNPFVAEGLKFTPLPVMHGEDYVSLGFEFGEIDRVIYLSDVSRIPPHTLEYLERRKEEVGQPSLLIIDSLHYDKPHETHFSFPETLEAIKVLHPVSAYLIGMTHQFDHELVNEELLAWSQREGIHVELSWDGLLVPVRL